MGFGNASRFAQRIDKRRKRVTVVRNLGLDSLLMPQGNAHEPQAAEVQFVNRFGRGHFSCHVYLLSDLNLASTCCAKSSPSKSTKAAKETASSMDSSCGGLRLSLNSMAFAAA